MSISVKLSGEDCCIVGQGRGGGVGVRELV